MKITKPETNLKMYYNKILVHNETFEIGQPVWINKMLLVYLGKNNIYKVFDPEKWEIIGDI